MGVPSGMVTAFEKIANGELLLASSEFFGFPVASADDSDPCPQPVKITATAPNSQKVFMIISYVSR
jgi:hypothetical protein